MYTNLTINPKILLSKKFSYIMVVLTFLIYLVLNFSFKFYVVHNPFINIKTFLFVVEKSFSRQLEF
jgi:hypothetical protein